MAKHPRVHVAAGVIVNLNGKILIARRPEHLHQGGLWEFPGGKLEDNEDTQQALVRELHEELGISVTSLRPLIRVHHDYPDKHVLLDVWYVDGFSGEAHGREGQPVEWVRPGDLRQFTFPAANQPILSAAQLPTRFLVTPEPGDEQDFMHSLQISLQAGIRLVQLRAHSLDDAAYNALARKCLELCHEHGAYLVLNRDAAMLAEVDADGLHLTASRLMSCKSRPVATNKLFSASCHTMVDIEHAGVIGADFVVAGSVKATSSHPGVEPMGWNKFRELTEKATMPVYALGGMRESDLGSAWQHGGQGIAAISSLWQS